MYAVLWILAVILVIWGIICIVNRRVLLGVVLIIVGLLVGPGGVSVIDFDDDGHGGARRVLVTHDSGIAGAGPHPFAWEQVDGWG